MWRKRCPKVVDQGTHQDINSKRHDENCDQKVCDGQADDEVVSGRLEGSLAEDSGYDEHVAEEGEEGKEDEN